jgi:sugar phosphate isomerase/epimerase
MRIQTNNYPSLTKSYKSFYPFKIGTTSFIYPDLYVPNVKMLGAYVDEIELLLFESAPVESLFSKASVRELRQLSRDLQISYNVHLPTDISISDPAPALQDQAVDTLIRIIERTAPLTPSSYTLHIPYPGNIGDDSFLHKWHDDVYRNLEKIKLSGAAADRLAIETLDYPLALLGGIIMDLNLSVCLDIGHLVISGLDVRSELDRYLESVSIIHLHGVENHKDHAPLDRLADRLLDSVVAGLEKFYGTVSLEVFDFCSLKSSLNLLENRWKAETEKLSIR